MKCFHRLKWIPSNYNNVTMVHIPNDQVWKPDIMVFNSVRHEEIDMTNVLAYSGGSIW